MRISKARGSKCLKLRSNANFSKGRFFESRGLVGLKVIPILGTPENSCWMRFDANSWCVYRY